MSEINLYGDTDNTVVGLLRGRMVQAVSDGASVFRGDLGGGHVPASALEPLLKKKKFKLASKDVSDNVTIYVWVRSPSFIMATVSERASSFVWQMDAETDAEEIRKFLAALLAEVKEAEPSTPLSVMSTTFNGLRISSAGYPGRELERDNYPDETLSSFDHVMEDLRSEYPCGKLVILRGAPGTGKTHLIRGMLHEKLDRTVVHLPPSLISQIDSPGFLTALGHQEEPILLIVEDADSCLIQRQDENMPSISALLNIGDGLLGHALDLRILLTTNADLEMDEALRRAGRLCREIEVGKLKAWHANAIFQRLGGHDSPFDRDVPLSDVYAAARSFFVPGRPKGSRPSKHVFLKEPALYERPFPSRSPRRIGFK